MVLMYSLDILRVSSFVSNTKFDNEILSGPPRVLLDFILADSMGLGFCRRSMVTPRASIITEMRCFRRLASFSSSFSWQMESSISSSFSLQASSSSITTRPISSWKSSISMRKSNMLSACLRVRRITCTFSLAAASLPNHLMSVAFPDPDLPSTYTKAIWVSSCVTNRFVKEKPFFMMLERLSCLLNRPSFRGATALRTFIRICM
mmetsp:Transcript_25401/g.56256  ORF Transcript_25401/g.56256 Transcript_25401/m.56256 type:complete len:205 (-) Transcript_25401:1858-2472(-)